MKTKSLFVVAAMSLALASCNNTPKKTSDWSRAIKNAMEEEFGMVVPYVTGLKVASDDIDFYEGQLSVYSEFDDKESAIAWADSYQEKLHAAGYTGDYYLDTYEEDGEECTDIYGEYSHTTDLSYVVYEETFEQPLQVTFNIVDFSDYYMFMLYAYLDVEYHYSESHTEVIPKINNVIGEGIGIVFPEGSHYSYRYMYDEDAQDFYFDVFIAGSTYSCDFFVQDLIDNNFYMQEGFFYYYWCLPWAENYSFTINDMDEDSNGGYYYDLSYYPNLPADIVEQFPATAICTYFNLDSSFASTIPEFSSDSNYDYKIWNDRGWVCVDAADPAHGDPEQDTLLNKFKSTLDLAGYTYNETSYRYSKVYEGVCTLYIQVQQDNNYFTASYYAVPAN